MASLTLWLSKPETQARIREMESGACAHIRLAAALNLSPAVRVLVRILEDFNTLASANPDITDAAYIRASERARKAAYHLYRLSRVTPLDESRLALVRGSARRAEAGARDATPVQTEFPPPSSPLPPTPPPTPPVSPSPRPSVALNGETSSQSPSRALGGEPSSPPSPQFSSLEELTIHLEQLAASIGLDTPDLDDTDNLPPLPPEFIALFPPEVAELLTPERGASNARTQAPDPVGSSP